jgi:hypothetical protein
MKTKLFILLLTMLPFLPGIASDTTFLGAREPHTISGHYSFYSARLTEGKEKQQLHTGGFTGSMVLGDDTLNSGKIRSGFFGVKDSLDQWLWYKKIEGQGYNQINTAIAYQNGWVVAGVFSDTIQVGNTVMISHGYQNVFLAFVNIQGEIVISRQISLTPAGGKQFLQKGSENTLFFGAEFTGQFQHEDSIYLSHGKRSVLLAKLNTTGDIEKTAIASSDAALDLRVFESLPGGRLLVGVGYRDTLHFGNHKLANSGISDFVLARMDEYLQIEQIKSSTGGGTKTLSGAVRHPGGFVFYGDYTGEFSWDGHSFPQENGRHIFIIKLVGNGNLVWKHTLNGYSQKNAVGLIAGQQNHLYLLGNYRGSMYFLDQEYITEDFTFQWFIARLSPSGEPQWLTFAENEESFYAGITQGTETGKLNLLGVNRFNNPLLFNQSLDSIKDGLFYMELQDCEFAKMPGFPSDTLFCGPGLLSVGDDYTSAVWNNSIESLTYQVETTGWVNVELTDKYGCKIQDTIYVEVLPPFEIDIAGNEKVCPYGGTAVLMVDTDADVIWNTGETGNLIYVNEEGEYFAEAINNDGCRAEDYFIVSNFELQPPILFDYYMLDPEGTLELFPGNYAAYNWSDGQTGAIFTISGQDYEQGTYYFSVDLTDFNTCVQQFDFMVDVINAQTSSGEVANDPPAENETTATTQNIVYGLVTLTNDSECSFSLYPNPGQETIYISNIIMPFHMHNENQLHIEYLIFGNRGELVLKEINSDNSMPWMINSLQNLSQRRGHRPSSCAPCAAASTASDDARVGAAAAEVAVQTLDDLLRRRPRRTLEQRDRGHHHPRRAVAALHRGVIDERPLHGVQPAARGEVFDGAHRGVADRSDRHAARPRRASVDQHRAGAALALATAELGADQAEFLAQHVEQRAIGVDGEPAGGAVDRQDEIFVHRASAKVGSVDVAGDGRRPRRLAPRQSSGSSTHIAASRRNRRAAPRSARCDPRHSAAMSLSAGPLRSESSRAARILHSSGPALPALASPSGCSSSGCRWEPDSWPRGKRVPVSS